MMMTALMKEVVERVKDGDELVGYIYE